jgi:hypothetical protein
MLKLEDFESVVADIAKYSYKKIETASIDRHYTRFSL